MSLGTRVFAALNRGPSAAKAGFHELLLPLALKASSTRDSSFSAASEAVPLQDERFKS